MNFLVKLSHVEKKLILILSTAYFEVYRQKLQGVAGVEDRERAEEKKKVIWTFIWFIK